MYSCRFGGFLCNLFWGWVCPGLFSAIKYNCFKNSKNQHESKHLCVLEEPSEGVWRFGLRVTTKLWVNTDPPAWPANSSCPLSTRHLKNVLQICRKAYTAFSPSPTPAMLMKAQHSWDFQICYPCGEIKVGSCTLHCRIERWALVIFVVFVAECRRRRWVQSLLGRF